MPEKSGIPAYTPIYEGILTVTQAEEIARLVKEGGLSLQDLRAMSAGRKRTELPEESASNPERRRQRVLEQSENAPPKESVIRERSIQQNLKTNIAEARAYLRAKYTNSDGQLVCQCCDEEMPFKIKELYYFEATQCVRALKKQHLENRLALCPTCAAMYQYADKTDDDEIRRRIVESGAANTASFVEIPISLAGQEHRLRFVGTHWFDLKTILEQTNN